MTDDQKKVFNEKFNNIKEGQIYKIKHITSVKEPFGKGERDHDKYSLIKITGKTEEYIYNILKKWYWDKLLYKNQTDQVYNRSFINIRDISNNNYNDIIFVKPRHPIHQQITNSMKEEENVFIVLNLEKLTDEENQEFKNRNNNEEK